MLNIILLWRFRSVSSLDNSLDIDIKDVRITSDIVNFLVLQVLGDIVQRDDGGLILEVVIDVTHIRF